MAHSTGTLHDTPPANKAPAPRQDSTWGTRVNLSSNAIAGVAAGFTSSVLTHPLDVVKTRFQVSLASSISCVSTLAGDAGLVSALLPALNQCTL